MKVNPLQNINATALEKLILNESLQRSFVEGQNISLGASKETHTLNYF